MSAYLGRLRRRMVIKSSSSTEAGPGLLASTECNILSAWRKTGLYPLDLNRVFETFSGLQANQTTVPILTTQQSRSVPDAIPDTPSTAEGFVALRRLVEGECQHGNELVQPRRQKVFNAAERAMTNCTLLEDQRQALSLQDRERKIRVDKAKGGGDS